MLPLVVQVALVLCLAALAAAQNTSALPTVDLGYEIYQANSLNATGAYYNFSNIRYAAPPLGNLRFAAPAPPAKNRTAIQTGSVGRICPQADPAWLATAEVFVHDYTHGIPYNASDASASSNGSATSLPPQDPRTTEDCLFLDVMVPQPIFEARNTSNSSGAAVLVWIYGGGYTSGDKGGVGNPAGLIARSEYGPNPGVIYVAMNYRLGAFGWLSGPTLQSNGTANAGLLDQRMALEWVQTNIHLFGGDPNRVTIFGESAGGGSVMHQITAYGGNKGAVPFQQALPQSPGFNQVPGSLQQETVFQTFLSLLNVSSIQEARQLPSATLITANIEQVGLASSYGMFTYGPVVDGDFVPGLPGKLLLQGSFNKNLTIMVGHNSDEGLLFTDPAATNDSSFAAYIQANFPDMSPSILQYVTGTLYPSVFNGTYGYTDQYSRAALAVSEAIFTCNTYYLDRAFDNRTYAYIFSVPPGIHGSDTKYTYRNGKTSGVNGTIALALQDYITSFAETGSPNRAGVPRFDLFGNGSQTMDLNITGIRETIDPAANARCLWWQKALYY
ncbi:MAG: hypothetical protein M1819_006091 [Sarea resinae]|nr:MAG: hypothetical protein M1819_006091 [Sarea resinae]